MKENIHYILSPQLYFDIMIQILSLAKANDMCKDVEPDDTGRSVHVKHLSSQRGEHKCSVACLHTASLG